MGFHVRPVQLRYQLSGEVHWILIEITFPIGDIPTRKETHPVGLDPENGAVGKNLIAPGGEGAGDASMRREILVNAGTRRIGLAPAIFGFYDGFAKVTV